MEQIREEHRLSRSQHELNRREHQLNRAAFNENRDAIRSLTAEIRANTETLGEIQKAIKLQSQALAVILERLDGGSPCTAD